MNTPRPILIAVCLLLSSIAAVAAAMTNEDVIKMVGAKVDQGVIMTAVRNSESKFDMSSDGLIALSKAGVPSELIDLMIQRASGHAQAGNPPAQPAAPASTAAVSNDNRQSPSEVLLLDGSRTVSMRYITPQVRTAARAFGLGGMATYSVLSGSSAATRIQNSRPSFLVSVPEQAQPESYVTIANFAVRRNDTREVLIGGGYMSYSSGITRDRVVPCSAEKIPDQSRAQKGFILYKVTPKRDLKPGEYAVILYTGEMAQMVSAWFSGSGNSYFDFGVDP